MKTLLLTILLAVAGFGQGWYAPLLWNTNASGNYVIPDITKKLGVGTLLPASTLSVAGGVGIGATYSTTAFTSGNVGIEGNLGIGTSTLSHKLTVRGSARDIAYITDNGSDDPQIQMYNGKLSKPAYTFIGYTSTGIYNVSGNIRIATQGSDRMHIDYTSGNVGIGTTSPANKVRVIGGIAADTVLYTTLTTISDTTLKHDIRKINWDLTDFKEVHPISFKYVKQVFNDVSDSAATVMSDITHYGFSAQEFNSLIADNNEKQVDLMQVTVALWLKVQELETRIKALEAK